jgi:hypothetical protein
MLTDCRLYRKKEVNNKKNAEMLKNNYLCAVGTENVRQEFCGSINLKNKVK